jgi:hypothetical protein
MRMRAPGHWKIAVAISVLVAGVTACSSEAGTPAVPPTAKPTFPQASASEPSQDAVDRLPAGRVEILAIDQGTRDDLRVAAGGAHAPGRSGDIVAHGTTYYGEVYGRTPATDTYYVLALIDQMYVWQQNGDHPWRYKGAFDARKCEPPIPRKLIVAWGEADLSPKKSC